MAERKGKPIEILLVEDSLGDARLTREALKEGKILNNLHIAKDGVEAIEFLRRKGQHTSTVRPDLILLDLNLPRKNGTEVLAEIKEDDDLKSIPVVILTVSQADEDIIKAYNPRQLLYHLS
jgi:two-component system, chemotaxis family, response regulator Rcp1